MYEALKTTKFEGSGDFKVPVPEMEGFLGRKIFNLRRKGPCGNSPAVVLSRVLRTCITVYKLRINRLCF